MPPKRLDERNRSSFNHIPVLAVVSRSRRPVGLEPVWSPTGREIFYRSVDGTRLMSVDMRTDPSLQVGTPRAPLGRTVPRPRLEVIGPTTTCREMARNS